MTTKNIKVSELIEVLVNMSPDSVVCTFIEIDEDDKAVFSAVDLCKEFTNVKYIDNNGNDTNGNIVVLF
jgi:hypothetical protein